MAALALISSNAIIQDAGSETNLDDVGDEAKAILFAARERGVMEVKGTNMAFDATERFLAVHVEIEPDHSLALRCRETLALGRVRSRAPTNRAAVARRRP